MEAVLVLNADYTLLEIINWKKAMSLLFREKVRVVEEYPGREIHTPSQTFALPAVIVKNKYVNNRKKIRFSRKNILARDLYTCQYCGAQPRNKKTRTPIIEELTIDHIVPRAQSRDGWVCLPWSEGKRVRVTSWENIATACQPCNSRKADSTLKSSGLVLKKHPRNPTTMDVVWMSLLRYKIPEEWKMYLPEGALEWKDYWDVELDPS